MRARTQILNQFEMLSPALQKAARFLVDHPNEVVVLSMRAVATKAGAQPATLVRLAQSLGYKGWGELKGAFTRDLGLSSESYGSRARSLTKKSTHETWLKELITAQVANLEYTEKYCSEALHRAAKLLQQSETVYVAGFRASLPVAYTLVYGYRLFRNSVQLIDGQNIGLEMQLRPIGKGDVVVVISFSPYSSEMLAIIEHVKRRGAGLLAMTDSDASPLALAADHTILFSIDSPSFFPSVTSAVSLAEALLGIMVAEGGSKAVANLDRSEQQLVELGGYIKAP